MLLPRQSALTAEEQHHGQRLRCWVLNLGSHMPSEGGDTTLKYVQVRDRRVQISNKNVTLAGHRDNIKVETLLQPSVCLLKTSILKS